MLSSAPSAQLKELAQAVHMMLFTCLPALAFVMPVIATSYENCPGLRLSTVTYGEPSDSFPEVHVGVEDKKADESIATHETVEAMTTPESSGNLNLNAF
jgi:hypothetical protein